MATSNKESKLWKKVKQGLPKCFLTRIESSTINGIPDIHAVSDSKLFWIELKSDEAAHVTCLLYTSPSPRDGLLSRMPSSA